MNEQPETWTRTKTKEIADCRVFKVREDFCKRESDGVEHSFFVIENPDWVNVVALTEDEMVVMIKQFRHGIEEIILEIPGGMIDEKESPEAAGRRELLEETGYSAREMFYLGKSRPNPALQNNWCYHFLALDCEQTGEAKFDEHESTVTKLLPLPAIPDLILTGEISHSLAVAAFQYFSLQYPRIK
jgi:8-oxo-dGTP pyrophosphatase MutT (NUDIX family)